MYKPLQIYMLALGGFLTAVAELVVAGILNTVAADLNISVALAGQLITAYSLAFAIGTPILTALTSRMDRKRVLIAALAFFIAGSLISFLSPNISVLMVSRVLLGLSGGVFLVAAMSAVTKLVPAESIGRAMSLLALGFSLAFVLGVPIGISIANRYDWHVIFLLLALVALAILIGIARILPSIEGDAPSSAAGQFRVLTNPVVVFGLLMSLLWSTGNSVQFTFINPYLEAVFRMNASQISLVMVGFGLFGVLGSRFGGYGVDRWGTVNMLTGSLAAGIVSFALLPLAAGSLWVGLLLLMVWVTSMFASAPALNTYFVQKAPESANLVLSLNMSFTHVGLALGAGAGGVLIEYSSDAGYNPWLAAAALVLALAAALGSFASARRPLRDTMLLSRPE